MTYTYSFHYDALEHDCTTIGNYLESDENLHETMCDRNASSDERWRAETEIERKCEQQIQEEYPGIHIQSVRVIGVTEPDRQFYYLPDHVQEL